MSGSDLDPNAPAESRRDETSQGPHPDADEEPAQRRDPADLCTAHELLGSYALVSQLASGHLTTVHRAHVAGGDGQATLAIKRLQYRNLNDQADRELLLAAGRAAMRLPSANFVRVLSVHEDPEPFLVMEHVAGVTLETLLAETDESEALRYALPILVDVLEALEGLHGLRDTTGTATPLVHGAPCARHVLIGTDGVARLFDLTHATGPGFAITARRSLRLSPAEMAPEQVLAPMHVDPRCDLFIVGTVLWRALTGQPLFEHEQREEALSQLLRKPILPPSAAGCPAGRRFDRICLRALARLRAERYDAAAEFARELKAEAERASLCASRAEIANLVATLAAANLEAASQTEVVLTPALAQERAEQRDSSAVSDELDEAPDVLTRHHQGSSSFGFVAAEAPAAAGLPGGDFARAPGAHAREAGPPGRDSGSWHEGLPSIFPQRDQPRTSAPFWLSGIAAAAAFVGGMLIDDPPWQSVDRRRGPEQRAGYRPETPPTAAAGASVARYGAFFENAQRSAASSALPPRALAEPPSCTPAVPSEATAPASPAPPLKQNQSAPSAAAGRARAPRFLSPLPPNPY